MNIDYDTGYFVTRTARAFMRVAEAQLRPLGLGVAHIPVLLCLAEEGALTQANIFIPFGQPIRWAQVRSNITGFAPNAWGFHPLPPLAQIIR